MEMFENSFGWGNKHSLVKSLGFKTFMIVVTESWLVWALAT